MNKYTFLFLSMLKLSFITKCLPLPDYWFLSYIGTSKTFYTAFALECLNWEIFQKDQLIICWCLLIATVDVTPLCRDFNPEWESSSWCLLVICFPHTGQDPVSQSVPFIIAVNSEDNMKQLYVLGLVILNVRLGQSNLQSSLDLDFLKRIWKY